MIINIALISTDKSLEQVKIKRDFKNQLDQNKYQIIDDPTSNEKKHLFIVIGGDGSLLNAFQRYWSLNSDAYFLLINAGNLGFYSDFNFSDYTEVIKILNALSDHEIKAIVENNFPTRKINLLEVLYKKQVSYALNEIIVTQCARTIMADIYINNSYLESFKGTGILCATPFGSCGYNKSINGPILMPSDKEKYWIYNEIAPCTNNKNKNLNNSLVLNSTSQVVVKLKPDEHNKNAFILNDSAMINLNIGYNDVIINLSKKYLKYLKLKEVTFIDRIKRSFLG